MKDPCPLHFHSVTMAIESLDNIPDIRSKRELAALCEVEDVGTGAVLRCTFTYVDSRNRAWFGKIENVRKYDLTVDDLKRCLNLVADEIIYPLATPAITVLTDQHITDCFVKRPKLLCLDNEAETRLLPKLLIEEAETLESSQTSSPYEPGALLWMYLKKWPSGWDCPGEARHDLTIPVRGRYA